MKYLYSISSLVVISTIFVGCQSKNSATEPIRKVTPPPIVTAAEWNSTPKEFPDSYKHTPEKILLHHAGVDWAAGSDPTQRIKNLQSWSISDRPWPDVPYHYLIAPDGRIYEGRDVRYKPDTNTNFDTTGYINVQLWGNFETQRINQEQLEATVYLMAWLMSEHGLTTADITTHRDAAPGQTTCPGKDFYRYFDGGPLLPWTVQARNGFRPLIELLPPMEDGPTELIPY